MTDTLSRLKELHSAATPGPWKAVETASGVYPGTWWTEIKADNHCVIGEIYHDDDGSAPIADEARANAALIVAAVNAIPALLAAVEALEKCRDKFRHYHDLHRLKCTAEGDEKADRNREMAGMCDTALDNLRSRI